MFRSIITLYNSRELRNSVLREQQGSEVTVDSAVRNVVQGDCLLWHTAVELG